MKKGKGRKETWAQKRMISLKEIPVSKAAIQGTQAIMRKMVCSLAELRGLAAVPVGLKLSVWAAFRSRYWLVCIITQASTPYTCTALSLIGKTCEHWDWPDMGGIQHKGMLGEQNPCAAGNKIPVLRGANPNYSGLGRMVGFRRKHNTPMTQLLCLRMGHSDTMWALIRRRKEQTTPRQTKGPCTSLPRAQGCCLSESRAPDHKLGSWLTSFEATRPMRGAEGRPLYQLHYFLLWQNTWEKQPQEERVNSDSSFEGTGYHCGDVTVAETWSSSLHCTRHQESENEEWWHPAHLSLFIQSRILAQGNNLPCSHARRCTSIIGLNQAKLTRLTITLPFGSQYGQTRHCEFKSNSGGLANPWGLWTTALPLKPGSSWETCPFWFSVTVWSGVSGTVSHGSLL